MTASTDRRRGTGRLALACLAIVLAPGCARKPAAGVTERPTSAEPAAQDPAEDPLGELARLEQRMRELGLPTPDQRLTEEPADGRADAPGSQDLEADDGSVSADVSVGGAEGSKQAPEQAPASEEAVASQMSGQSSEQSYGEQRCSELCSLSESICDLELMICALAVDHEDDRQYLDACDRAGEDCGVARDACQGCEG